jgi:hypothetical protein
MSKKLNGAQVYALARTEEGETHYLVVVMN